MLRVLMPVDGSESAIRAVKLVIRKAPLYKEPFELHLLNVQHAFPGTLRGVHQQAQEIHREEGLKALAPARKLLDEAGVTYAHHIGVGDAVEVIAHYVKDKRIEQLVMGTRGLGSVSGLLMGSVTSKIIQLVDIPILLVK